MHGELEIIVRNARTRRVVREERNKNMIVAGFKSQSCHLLAGDIGVVDARRHIKSMQFGTGTIPEAASDEGLQLPITPIKTVSVSYPRAGFSDDYYVQFYTALSANQANGFPISEAGLVCEDGTLVARKTFAAINKTVDYIVEFRWRIRC